MPSALNLVTNAVAQQQPQIIYATVSTAQPLPESFDDLLYVVELWNPNHYRTITDGIPAIHGATLPAAGAGVVLVFDNTRALRIVWWAGSYTAP